METPGVPAIVVPDGPDAGGGLDRAEAARRRRRDGPNDLPRGRPDTVVRQVGRQLTDVVVLVLLVAGALTAAVGDITDTTVIAAVIVVNTVLGVSQERRAGRVLAALADLTAPRATVVRSGTAVDIDARDVVTGDLVVLRAGDIVPADLRLRRATALQLDESAMTGESLPVDRGPDALVLGGTVVTRGRAAGTVTAVGAATRLGGLARSVGRRTGPTPLQRQLRVLGRMLATAVTVAAVAVGVVGLAAGRSLETAVVVGLSLAVAAIPESLPAVVAVSLAMAARRMAAVGVLVRRLAAVEALGSVTTLATDKTGTLTTGVPTLTATRTDDVHRLLEMAALCNDAPLDVESSVRVDPLDAALVTAAVSAGVDVRGVRAQNPRVGEEPFEAATARMVTRHETTDGRRIEIAKGAPESIAGLVTAGGGELPGDVLAAAGRFAAGGARVLALAERGTGPWRWTGLLALGDPLRPEAPAFVAAFRRAGVEVVIVTGDHAATAGVVADALHLSGTDGRPAVFARVRPEEKARIVTRLQEAGEVVAVTGDGVNDAPALRRADVGVAMGRRGTEVARQAADLVLTSDDLGALAPAIGEGRRVLDNLRRFLLFGLAGGFAEVAVMLLGSVIGQPVPLTAAQILWINLLTHGATGVAMGNEAAEADVATRAPRPVREKLLNPGTARRIAVIGTLVTVGSLAAGGLVDAAGGDASAAVFATLTLSQLAVALGLRPPGTSWRANAWLPASVVVNIGLLLCALYVGPLRRFLHTAALTSAQLALAAAVALVIGAAVAVMTRLGTGRRAARG